MSQSSEISVQNGETSAREGGTNAQNSQEEANLPEVNIEMLRSQNRTVSLDKLICKNFLSKFILN